MENLFLTSAALTNGLEPCVTGRVEMYEDDVKQTNTFWYFNLII